MTQYVVIERDEAGGYSAWAPNLLGVVAAAAVNAIGAETVTTAA